MVMMLAKSSDERTALLEEGRNDPSKDVKCAEEKATTTSTSSSVENDDDDDTMEQQVVAAGPEKELPREEEDSCSSWIRLIAFFLASVVAGGILPGQNVYNRLFCEAGLFRYACETGNTDLDKVESCCPAQWLLIANVMNILSLSVTFMFLLSGLLFDMIGGRRAAVLGCAILFAGLLLISMLVYFLENTSRDTSTIASPMVETAIFVVGVLLVDSGSFCANMGFFSFLWHLPHRQALVLSLSNSCFSCASFIPLVLAVIMDRTGSSLAVTLSLYGVTVLVSGGVCWLTVPTVEEYRARAFKVLGVPIPRQSSTQGWRKSANMQLRGAWEVLSKHAKLHSITIGVIVLAWLPPFVYMSMSDPLGQEIFHSAESGNRMGDLFVKMNTLLGLIVGPTCGVVMDSFKRASDGLIEVAILLSASMAIVAFMCPIPSWTVQTINIGFGCAGQVAVLLFITRYSVIFSTPQRVGSVAGLLTAGFGLASLLPILLVSLAIANNGSYVRPTVITSVLGAVGWAVYVVYLKRTRPWPSFPVVLPEDERHLCKNFCVGTIEEAAYVAGMTKDEFLALSASSNVVDQRRLVDAALSTEAGLRMLHVAHQRSHLISFEPACSEVDYPIPVHATGVVKGRAKTSLDTINISFNGHGGFGGKSEPSLEWIFESIGRPDDPRRIAMINSFMSPSLECAEAFGIILEIKDEDRNGSPFTAAAVACYPPGGLEDNGSTVQAGGDRWYYGLAKADVAPIFMDRQANGEQFMQRLTACKHDTHLDERRKKYGQMWYVA